jgi:RNA polymerase sigma-70 factor (ECF subfamily)
VTEESGHDEAALVGRLRQGDAEAFRELVRRHHASMLRVAASFVPSAADAEDVVQDTWIAVIRGIGAFEGRSRVRSWIFTILVNRARSHGVREARRAAGPPSGASSNADDGPYAIPEERFVGRRGRGAWREPVPAWQDDPQLRLDSATGVALIMAAIARLPAARRQVVVLRDVEGWTAAEVAELLGLSAANQRVLLHRARAALRLALEEHLASQERPPTVSLEGSGELVALPDDQPDASGSTKAVE